MENISTQPPTSAPPQTPFSLTDAAAARIVQIRQSESKPDLRFRVTVKGGGCSGFQYEFNMDDGIVGNNDTIVSHAGAEVVIDDVSIDLLKGSVLDYTEDLAQAGFSIKNPNATAKCGCGNSFSVSL
ncbi:MAG: iron-sulfur cluster insertion protein ErpA [Rickettsiales bacterium]|nr:iron-sulfur cluster insertion protein ErpA [Rickettsiales bacterium]